MLDSVLNYDSSNLGKRDLEKVSNEAKSRALENVSNDSIARALAQMGAINTLGSITNIFNSVVYATVPLLETRASLGQASTLS